MSPKTEAYKYNSKVLWDQSFKIIPQTSSYCQRFEMNIPLNWHVNYFPAATTVSTGALKIAVFSQDSASSNASILASFSLSYTDN